MIPGLEQQGAGDVDDQRGAENQTEGNGYIDELSPFEKKFRNEPEIVRVKDDEIEERLNVIDEDEVDILF
jgi:hypothetical protein